MAKIPCEIIRDLLPLYQDDICSEKSRNAIEEHIKECESCRTYLKKMEGEIPIETDKIEGTDEEWKGFREFSEKVSRKLNGRIVMACGVVFLICMMLTVALYSDAFQSYHLSRIAAKDIKAEEVYQLKDGRLYVQVKSRRRITGLVLSSDRYGYSYRNSGGEKMLLELHVSRRILAHMKYLWIRASIHLQG